MKNNNTEEGSMIKSLKKQIRRRLPILSWARKYTRTDFVSDLIAGVTVGLTVVPQSMAYAAIAGLSPEYGLYSSYLGVLVYVVLGSCVQATIGPTAVMGLLTFQTCGQDYPSCAILTGFYAGLVELLLAVLRLGWVVSFISEPVTVGFTAGAAVTIMSSQVKSFFGMSGEKGEGFVGYWKAIWDSIGSFQAGDSIVGIVAFVCLMLLRKLKDLELSNKPLKTTLWLISLSRNVIVILITSILAYIWTSPPFKLVGKVNGGFPSVSLPPFLLPIKNLTSSFEDPEITLSFIESWKFISTGPIVIALISILQNVAISKAFGSGQKVDATQEMIALGTASTLGGFVSSIPISASFSRSAVNEASGVRSPLGGLYTGILVLLSLGFLTPSFYYIPKASLAAVIIAAVMFMVEYEKVPAMWKISKMDAVAALITFVASLLLGMEYGILIGVGISLASLLYSSLSPAVDFSLLNTKPSGTQPAGDSYILISPGRSSPSVVFPCVDHISSTVQKIALKHKSIKVLVLDCSSWVTLDYTAATSVVSVVKGLRKNGQTLLLLNASQDSVNVLRIAGLSSDSPLVSGAAMEATVSRVSSEESSVLKEVLEGGKGNPGGVRDRRSSSLKSGGGSDSDAQTSTTDTATSSDGTHTASV